MEGSGFVDPFSKLGALPPGAREMLERQAAGFDPAQLPDMTQIEFTSISLKWMMEPESGKVILQFWIPLLPFIKFSIPFHNLNAMEDFTARAAKALEVMRGEFTKREKAENNGTTPTDELPSLRTESEENME